MSNSQSRSRTIFASIAVAALIGLGACSSSDGGTTTDPATTNPATTAATSAAPMTSTETTGTDETTGTETSASSTDATTQTNAPGGSLENATAAIKTAEDASGGGKAIEVDYDNTQWKVSVAKDGKEVKYVLGQDGTSVTSQAPPKDDDDVAKIANAKITMQQALKTAFDKLPGTLDEAEIETHKGKLAFGVEIYPADGSGKKTVFVDATDGSVVEVIEGD